jgi:hypothetical protein
MTFLQQSLFYLGACLYPIGFLLAIVLTYGKQHPLKGLYPLLKDVNKLFIIFPLGLIYTCIVLYTLCRDPMLLLNMSYPGVVEQYSDPWLQVSSTIHFEYSDLLVTYFALYVARKRQLSFKFVVPFLPLMLLWNPVGSLALGICITLYGINKKDKKIE